MRVAYAGRNGHPYTSIGKLLVQQGVMDLETMTLERLMGWLKDNPEPARTLMRQNRSYIFFREAAELAEAQGPIGGAGIPLTPGRSRSRSIARSGPTGCRSSSTARSRTPSTGPSPCAA